MDKIEVKILNCSAIKEAEKNMSKKYRNRIYAEAGDIFRDSKRQKSDSQALEYYKKVNCEELESYRVLYKSALLYEKKGEVKLKWYMNALECYIQILNLFMITIFINYNFFI